MPAFFIENFGCRATDADTSALSGALQRTGLATVAAPALADVVVLNTCTVTHRADAQAREAIRKIHRLNPSARIVVTGCYAQRAPEELAGIDGVAWVVGNSHQSEIPAVVRAMLFGSEPAPSNDFFPLAQLTDDAMSLARGPAKILTGDIFADSIWPFSARGAQAAEGDRTRPIVKIQDGCNSRCSYCVIPLVRGRSQSLPPDDVIREVRSRVLTGAKEIVLSGINLGSYGRDLLPRTTLASLVRRILNQTALEQLRFSSMEPQDITEEFVELIESSDRIAPHFHVPLQSGSDRILRKMHRWYRAAYYAERIRLIRHLLPLAAIGADVIVGFPGETREDFEATAEFVSRLPFTYLHVFSFSPRPGTAAAHLSDPVEPKQIGERARALRSLGEQKAAAFRGSQLGQMLRALTLARSGDDWTESLTGNYLKVKIPGRHPANQWHQVVITG
ncbi:MAG TPA: tRNA (N(6)-L-threonylcarbamoyladenosine(37)-C(2))-methylthiotransferase MtaB [Candidatus Acidoferrales bacterium]|nr:tRNA (N(6)-L-threonylcarbamoyladenosine(37)-C(2))-methylthiotransferase MtaB [Candidatus Acidoferrales bacterium]